MNFKSPCPQALLELAEPLGFPVGRATEIGGIGIGRQALQIGGIAQVEESVFGSFRVAQYAVLDLNFGQRMLPVSREPWVAGENAWCDLPDGGAVSFSEQAYEKGSAAVDLGETNGQHVPMRYLLVGHAPA